MSIVDDILKKDKNSDTQYVAESSYSLPNGKEVVRYRHYIGGKFYGYIDVSLDDLIDREKQLRKK